MHLVTGGAGFIGSNIAAALAERGDRVVICDWFGAGDKWRNVAKHDVHDFILPEQMDGWLGRHAGDVRSVVHMGAISATTERDADLILRSNFQLSLALWRFCAKHALPFIYASSAATYGGGDQGFEDRLDVQALGRLRPLNPYGWSKHAFDRRVLHAVSSGEAAPPKWAGLKFFNVYGPNEYHKESMRSVIAVNYAAVASGAPLKLFRSYRSDYEHGGQKRDFVYVGDCVAVVLWMLDNAFPSSVYNVASGQARSWLDLGRAMFAATGQAERIEFIDMPDALRDRYQYFTEGSIAKLRSAGYTGDATRLEDGVARYVQDFLSAEDPYR